MTEIVILTNCVGDRVIGRKRYRKDTMAETDTRSCRKVKSAIRTCRYKARVARKKGEAL